MLRQADALRLVAAGQNRLPPVTVFAVPLHSFRQAGLERLSRAPAQLAFDLRCIDRVATIMSRTILDEGHELASRPVGRRHQLIEVVANGGDDLLVGSLVAPSDVVRLAACAVFQHQRQRACVVLDIEPVADIQTVAIDRHRLTCQPFDDHVRNELLGEMIWPVVIGAVRHHGRQSVSLPPGANQVVRRGFAGRVRRVRCVGRRFREQALGAERAVHLVGRDVEKPEIGLLLRVDASPEAQGLLQQGEGADHVGVDELARAVDRAINMTLGRQVHHSAGRILIEQLAQRLAVADIHLAEGIAWMSRCLRNRGEVGGVGELVDVDDKSRGIVEQVSDDRRAYEARAAGHEDGLALETHRLPVVGEDHAGRWTESTKDRWSAMRYSP